MAILTLDPNLKNIGKRVFSGCGSLKEVIIPDSVTIIGENAFEKCTRLESVVLPGGLEIISDGLFSGDENLASIVIPDTVESIGKESFAYCGEIKNLILPDSLREIGAKAFCDTGISAIVIPAGVMLIDEYAFDGSPLQIIVFEGAPPTMWSTTLDGISSNACAYYPEVWADRWTETTRNSCGGGSSMEWYPYCRFEDGQIVTAHSFGEGVVTKEATYDQSGMKEYTCVQCGFIKTETIPKLVKPVPVMSKKDAEKLYSPVLDMFYYNVKTNWKYYKYKYPGSGRPKLTCVSHVYPFFFATKSGGKKIGYCFNDVNSDGTPELLIGAEGTKNNDVVYDMYTYAGRHI